jgi:hypothetical protein
MPGLSLGAAGEGRATNTQEVIEGSHEDALVDLYPGSA